MCVLPFLRAAKVCQWQAFAAKKHFSYNSKRKTSGKVYRAFQFFEREFGGLDAFEPLTPSVFTM
jgi:hypothetical protein